MKSSRQPHRVARLGSLYPVSAIGLAQYIRTVWMLVPFVLEKLAEPDL